MSTELPPLGAASTEVGTTGTSATARPQPLQVDGVSITHLMNIPPTSPSSTERQIVVQSTPSTTTTLSAAELALLSSTAPVINLDNLARRMAARRATAAAQSEIKPEENSGKPPPHPLKLHEGHSNAVTSPVAAIKSPSGNRLSIFQKMTGIFHHDSSTHSRSSTPEKDGPRTSSASKTRSFHPGLLGKKENSPEKSSLAESEAKEAALSPTNEKKMIAIEGVRVSLGHSWTTDILHFLEVVSYMDLSPEDLDFIKRSPDGFYAETSQKHSPGSEETVKKTYFMHSSFIDTCLQNEFLTNVLKGVEERGDENAITDNIKKGKPQACPATNFIIAVNELRKKKHVDPKATLGEMEKIKTDYIDNKDVNIADFVRFYDLYKEQNEIEKLMGLFLKARETLIDFKTGIGSGRNIIEGFRLLMENLKEV